jgi:hypothetical protein
MALVAAFNSLDNELDLLANELRSFAATKSPINAANRFSLVDECLLEGLLSRVWQAWCGFARSCVIGSCAGSMSAFGGVIPTLPDALSDAHVSGAAVKAKNYKANPPYWGSTNALLRVEPTCGDVDILNRILTRLRPANHLQLLAAFSSISSSAKALQLIRNGAAHHNNQTLGDIRTLQSSYLVFRIDHPTHALFWVEPSTRDFLVTFAIDELKVAAQAAIA